MADSSFPVYLQLVLAIFEKAEDVRRENLVLRRILRLKGLSEGEIRKKAGLSETVSPEEDSYAGQLRQVADTLLKHLSEEDLRQMLEEMPIKGPPQ